MYILCNYFDRLCKSLKAYNNYNRRTDLINRLENTILITPYEIRLGHTGKPKCQMTFGNHFILILFLKVYPQFRKSVILRE